MAQEEETPHIAAVRKQWMLKKLAAEKKNIPYAPADDLETTLAKARAEEERMFVANLQIGKMIKGHGIFLGTWQPQGLSQTFNVFAAPQDLTNDLGNKETYLYDDAVKRVAGLKNWHGSNGTNYANDKEIYAALKDGSYLRNGSGWFIPPRELLEGKDIDNKNIQPDNLYAHRNKDALKGTFTTLMNRINNSGFPEWYWSSTKFRDVQSASTLSFEDGRQVWYATTSGGRMSCRPVRLELRS